jgi:hypothetical protein
MKKIFILASRLLIIASIAVSGLYAQMVPEMMYYKFDVAGTTVLNEASTPVGTNPATILGQTVGGTGQFGMALVGNGLTSTSNYVNTGWATSLSGPWTISLWMNNIPSTTTLYYYFGDATAGSFRAFIGGVAGANNIILRGTGVTDVLVSNIVPGPSVVHFVYNGTDIKAYLNGALVNTVAQGTISLSGAGPFKVGGYSSTNSIPSGALLDEFRMYNRALDAAEVGMTWNQSLPMSTNAPYPPTNPSPMSGSIGQQTSGTLTWTFGIQTETYDLWFGPAGSMVKVIDNQPSGATGSYPFSGLNYYTTYEWQVIARNSAKLETAGPVWNFRTWNLVTTYPYLQDFETFVVGTNATGYLEDWYADPTNTTSLYRWNVDEGGTPSTSTGPTVDHTTGTSTGNYIYTEASNGSAGSIAYVYTCWFDLTGLTTPAIEFWYHMYGSTMGELHLDIFSGGAWINDITPPLIGQQQTAQGDPYLVRLAGLGAYLGQTVQFRFRAIRSSNYYGDMAVDDVKIYDVTYGNLEGYVYKYGTTDPISGAVVSFDTYSATTGGDGHYLISNALTGTYDVTCTATGYFTETVTGVQILDGQTTSLDYYLKWAEIVVNPTSFSVTLPPDAQTDEYLTITNNGTGALTYTSAIQFLTEAAGINPAELGEVIPRPAEQFTADRELSPTVQKVTITTDNPGDVPIDIDIQAYNGDTRCLGGDFDGTYYWVSGGNSGVTPYKLYKHALDGTLIASYDQPSQATTTWGIRDLAFDGTYIYGGSEDGFYKFDPATGTFTTLFTGNLGLTCIRALCYYPVTGNFLASNWATGIVEFNKNGTIITTHTAPAGLAGMYGLAYDSWNDKLWIFDQSGTPATTFFEYDLSTNALTGLSYAVPMLSGLTDQIAGGAFYSISLVPGKAVVGGIVQGTANDHLFAMELNVTETWLSITANQNGTVPGSADGSLDMTLHFDATGYAAGTVKTANINISSNASNNPVVSVPVTMTVSSGIQLDLKLFLEGPYNDVTDEMSTFINGILPLNQPFNPALPYYGNNNPCWLYAGAESVAAIPNADVVDWVMVEIRDGGPTGAFTVAKQALFLLKDGSIVGLDGSSLPQFQLTLAGDLYVVVYHRNHLGVMNATPIPNSGGNLYVWDFTTGSGQFYGGSNGAKELETGIWGTRSGDGDANKQVNNDDKIVVWRPESGGAGYLGGDYNLDMQVNNSDKIDFWAPNGGSSSQVPN